MSKDTIKSEFRLYRCPFCAGDAILELESGHSASPDCWVAHCLKCSARIEGLPVDAVEGTEEMKKYLKDEAEKVGKQWNRRQLFED